MSGPQTCKIVHLAEYVRARDPEPSQLVGLLSAEQLTELEDLIGQAVNNAAALVLAQVGDGERDHDLIGLVINATVHLLTHPDASFDEVVRACYADSPETVRGWWGWS